MQEQRYYWMIWCLSLAAAVMAGITVSQYLRFPGHFPMNLGGKTLLVTLVLATVLILRRRA